MNSPISKDTSEIIECPAAPRKIYPHKSLPTPQAGPVSAPRKLFEPDEFPGKNEAPEKFLSETPPSESQINAAMTILNKIPIINDSVSAPSVITPSVITPSVVSTRRKCKRHVYKGQPRERECGKPIKSHKMCRRHLDMKWGCIKNKNGKIPSL